MMQPHNTQSFSSAARPPPPLPALYRLHGELAGALVRDSAAAVQRELVACYALIEARGRGVVYYGSARLREESPHWGRTVELGRDVAGLLGVTTWSGGEAGAPAGRGGEGPASATVHITLRRCWVQPPA